MAIPKWRQLSPTTEAQRRAFSRIGPADLTNAERFIATLVENGKTSDLEGRTVGIPAQRVKEFFNSKSKVFKWDASDAIYRNAKTGRIVPESIVKAGGESVVANAQAQMARLDRQLRAGEIIVDGWETGIGEALKSSRIAQAGLSWGGVDKIPDAAIKRIEDGVFENLNGTAGWKAGVNAKGEFPGLHRFAVDIRNGRYGAEQLANSATPRTLQYAESTRTVYENEVLYARLDAGHSEGCRLMAAVEHCFDCVTWAALGWMAIEVLLAEYPIGASVCGSRCYCVVVTRREGGRSAAGVTAAIERAKERAATLELATVGRMKTT